MPLRRRRANACRLRLPTNRFRLWLLDPIEGESLVKKTLRQFLITGSLNQFRSLSQQCRISRLRLQFFHDGLQGFRLFFCLLVVIKFPGSFFWTVLALQTRVEREPCLQISWFCS